MSDLAAAKLSTIAAGEVRDALKRRDEIALIDLREEHIYAQGHPLFAAHMPLGRLELEARDRIPRADTLIVLYDDGEGRVARAAARLGALGYGNIASLKGGLQGWVKAGLPLFRDLNTATKAFGEWVERQRHTPSIGAHEAQSLLASGNDVVVLDSRRFDEYQTMSIPGAVSVPGAELVLRARALAPDPATTVIVNCAGRTRGILGAQSLLNAGLPNPVLALRNGTPGWTMAGLALDHGATRRFPEPDAPQAEEGQRQARAVADRAGVRRLTPEGLAQLAEDKARTLYRFDVRTPEEFAAGHLPGFRSAPGGQLVLEIDVFAPVRGARIVLADDRRARADISASWLAQMGWEVHVLDGGFDGPLESGPWRPTPVDLPVVQTLTPGELQSRLAAGDVVVLDLAPSRVHAEGHIPTARFVLSGDLPDVIDCLPEGRDIVLVSPDERLAHFAAEDIENLSLRRVLVMQGGTQAWAAEGRTLTTGLEDPLSAPDDVYRRPFEGAADPVAALEAYFAWQQELASQLYEDRSHGFTVL